VTPATPSTTPDLLPKLLPIKKEELVLAALAASPDLAASPKEEAAAAPLVIKLPADIAGSIKSNLPDIVSGNNYNPSYDYSSASASAQSTADLGQLSSDIDKSRLAVALSSVFLFGLVPFVNDLLALSFSCTVVSGKSGDLPLTCQLAALKGGT